MQGHYYLQSLLACAVLLFVYVAHQAIAMDNSDESVVTDLSDRLLPNTDDHESRSFEMALKHKQTELVNKLKDHIHIQLSIRNVKTTSVIDSAKKLVDAKWVEKQDTTPTLTPSHGSLESMEERFFVKLNYMQKTKNNPYTLRMILSLISNELVDPRNRLFTSKEGRLAHSSFGGSVSDILQIDRFPHQPSHAAYIHPMMHTECKPRSRCWHYFKSIGKVIGVAILNKQYLDLSFTSLFYKYILGIHIDMYDIEQVDANLFNHLQQVKDNAQYLSTNMITMTYKHYSKSGYEVRDLIKNGHTTMVTDHNKYTYIAHVIQAFIKNHISPAMTVLCAGLYEVIPIVEFEQFNEEELKVLISGNPKIDLSDFQDNYSVYPVVNRPILYETRLQWFWQMVNEFDGDMKCRLLLYVTGTSRLPIDGFSAQWSYPPHHLWFNLFFHHKVDWIDSSPGYGQMWLPSKFQTYEEMKSSVADILIKRGGVSAWYFPQCKQLKYKH